MQIAQDLYGGQIGLDRFSVFIEDLSRIAALRIRGLNPDPVSGTLLHNDSHLKNQQSSGSRLGLGFQRRPAVFLVVDCFLANNM